MKYLPLEESSHSHTYTVVFWLLVSWTATKFLQKNICKCILFFLSNMVKYTIIIEGHGFYGCCISVQLESCLVWGHFLIKHSSSAVLDVTLLFLSSSFASMVRLTQYGMLAVRTNSDRYGVPTPVAQTE